MKSFLFLSVKLQLLLGAWLITFNTFSQDRIYTTDGAFQEGEITRVDDTMVEYKLVSGNSEVNQRIQSLQVLAVFFPNGQFEVFPFEEKNILSYEDLPNLTYDLVITQYGEILKGEIISLANNQIKFSDLETNETIDLGYTEVILGIYSSGKHAMFQDPAQSLRLLKYLGKEVKLLARDGGKSALNTQNEGTVPIEQEVANTQSELSQSEASSSPDGDLEVNLIEFQDKAMQKIDDLGSFISIISNKSTFPDQANQAIDLAINLFISEESTVEVSTVGYNESIRRKIRDYLVRLKLLKYDRVEVKWADLNYVSDFRLGPDGNYYGTVSLKQTFDGFMDNKIAYSDVTEKQVEIVLKGFKKAVGGEEEIFWDVLLSDIGVLDTKNR